MPRPVVLILFMMVVFAGVMQACVSINIPDADKVHYTSANIWFEHPDKIPSVNHHQGAILPVGTQVTIESVTPRAIHFVDQRGTRYRLILMRKYTGPEFTIEQLFKQYFTLTDPMGKTGEFMKLSEMERGYVKSGRIRVGMSKVAVLMAYGYPPSHMTPSTDADVWKYWDHKFRARLVHFRNNRVEDIEKDL
jgi:hypothetical protein